MRNSKPMDSLEVDLEKTPKLSSDSKWASALVEMKKMEIEKAIVRLLVHRKKLHSCTNEMCSRILDKVLVWPDKVAATAVDFIGIDSASRQALRQSVFVVFHIAKGEWQ